jgi:predicted nucleic acid-binding protein
LIAAIALLSWVKTELVTIQPPLLSCKAVISEAWFLLQRVSNGRETLVGLLKSQQILVTFQLNEEVESITELLTRYLSVPISLADASLVRMAERYPGSLVLTLDSRLQCCLCASEEEEPPAVVDCTSLALVDAVQGESALFGEENQASGNEPEVPGEDTFSAAPAAQNEKRSTAMALLLNTYMLCFSQLRSLRLGADS